MSDRRPARTRWYRSLAVKVSLVIGALVLVSILVFAVATLREEAEHTNHELVKTGMFVAHALARQAALPLVGGDRAALEALIDALQMPSVEPSVRGFVASALILDRDGALLAQAGRPEDVEKIAGPGLPGSGGTDSVHRIDPHLVEVQVPILHRGESVGQVRLGITQEYRYELLQTVQRRTLVLMGGLAAVSVLVGLWFSGRLIRPLRLLSDSARKVGERRWGESVTVSGADEIAELASTFNEMSLKLKQAFEESMQATNRLIQADKFVALGTLSATLAHELKNPLGSIKMIMESATEQEEKIDCTRQDFDVMLDEVRRMEAAVNDILGLAGPQEVELQLNDLNGVIRDVFALARRRLEIAGIHSVLDLDERVPAFPFDPGRIERVLLNLIVNAVEAMPTGGELGITTGWSPERREVDIEVRDDGVGISDAIQSRIFDPFFTTKEGGTGIGLSLAYRVVQDHGGEIQVQSEKDVGTTFLIVLPVEPEAG